MSGGAGTEDRGVRLAALGGAPRASVHLLYALVALIAVAILWASFASLEEVTRGDGKVIPSRQIQVVQAPERGIVQAIDIEEGDVVAAGQVLVRIDDTGFSSELGEVQKKRLVL
ncbi:MAG TPA: biotin/lipoyl-binding protein, partial [Hyphomicrobiales bacterium]|nr:biotin/lipoyl-binding protein [Hyphomicrobiales bacterium]